MFSQSHTIILYQSSKSQSTRRYQDFPTLAEALDGVCKLYEAQLKRLNPKLNHIQYDISDLFQYVDDLPDISFMVFDDQTTSYVPRGRKWIKRKVLNRLKKMGEQPAEKKKGSNRRNRRN